MQTQLLQEYPRIYWYKIDWKQAIKEWERVHATGLQEYRMIFAENMKK